MTFVQHWFRFLFIKSLAYKESYMSSDVTQITSYVSTKILRYEPAKQLIIAWLNGHFMGLIGLIHEILDREKLVGLMQNVEVLCSIRNQCLDLSKKGTPIKYKPWSYNILIWRQFRDLQPCKRTQPAEEFCDQNFQYSVDSFGLWSSQYS